MKKEYVWKMTKRALAALPVIFLSMGGMLALVLVCMTAFQVNGRIRVGVTMSEEDKMMAALLSYIEQMNDISKLCEFDTVSEEEGRRQLEQGEISALLVVPEGMLDQIYQGKDTGVHVYLPHTPTLESGMIQEFSEAGVSLVLSAKAGDYTAYELYRQFGISGTMQQVSKDMNGGYITFIMMQERLFDNIAVTGKDGLSDSERYMTAGITCLLFLLGIPCVSLLRGRSFVLTGQLRRKGVSHAFQYGTSLILMMMCLYAAGICGLAVIYRYLGRDTGFAAAAFFLLPVCFLLASLFHFLYSFSKGMTGMVLMVFLLAVLLVFLPGGIFPPCLLPESMVKLGQQLPGGLMMQGFYRGIWQEGIGAECLWLLAYGCLFSALNVWMGRKGGQRA